MGYRQGGAKTFFRKKKYGGDFFSIEIKDAKTFFDSKKEGGDFF